MMSNTAEPTTGFENINCFFDVSLNKHVAKILPGQYYVSYGQHVIGTVLGSCVSACARDKTSSLGAMNHFMLPDSEGDPSAVDRPHRYGAYAMEHMLNDLFRRGVKRENLEIKIVGGGAVMSPTSKVGERNIQFVREYLRNEGFTIAAADVGTSFARQVIYDVTNGRMRVKHIDSIESVRLAEAAYREEVTTNKPASEIELF